MHRILQGVRATWTRWQCNSLSSIRSLRDCGWQARHEWAERRSSRAYLSAFDLEQPLVSICIATYNRGPLLVERSVRSALAQTYTNLEVVVVGDGCTDCTSELMASIRDPRVRFTNLPERGHYPSDPEHRWMVAGTVPMNEAMRRAQGQFLTHLDDDDEHPPHRIEVLLRRLQADRSDLIWHPFEYESSDGRWKVNDARGFRFGSVTTSSIFYHREWRAIEWNIDAWKRSEPGDWNRLRRIRFLGARLSRHPESLLRHYRERSQTRG